MKYVHGHILTHTLTLTLALVPLLGAAGCDLGGFDDETDTYIDQASAGKQHFVSPGGGSKAKCTQKDPCSVATGISKAQSGDQVVFENGTYRIKQIATKRAGVTFRAQNEHRAKIIGTSLGTPVVTIRHSNTVVKGFHFDCQDRARGIVLHNGTYKNVRIENNRLFNARTAGIKLGQFSTRVDGVVVVGNYIEKTGVGNNAEGIYIGSSKTDSGSYIRNVEVMGNEFLLTPENGIDCKKGDEASNIEIHHNIFRDFSRQPWSDRTQTGVIACSAKNVDIYRNYFHDGTVDTSVIRVAGNSNIRVRDNLFENITGTRDLLSHKSPQASSSKKTVIEGNYLKNVSATRAEANSGWIVRDNFGFDKPLDNAKFRSFKNKVLSEIEAIRGGKSARAAVTGEGNVDGAPLAVAADGAKIDGGEWLVHDLEADALVTSVDVGWADADRDAAYVEIQLSDDGALWTTAFAGVIGGSGDGFDRFDLVDGLAAHLRIHARDLVTGESIPVASVEPYGY